MSRRPGVLLFSAIAIAILAGGARRRAVTPGGELALDARRSFVVTDQAILDAFPFERVMHALVARSGTRTTAVGLYQQLFDTQNPRPGLVARDAPHCDDFMVDARPAFNGLPRRCRRTARAPRPLLLFRNRRIRAGDRSNALLGRERRRDPHHAQYRRAARQPLLSIPAGDTRRRSGG